MALSAQELQRARELKAQGVSTTLIMGDIAKARQGKQSIVSEALQPQKRSLFSRVVSDIPNDLKEGFLGVGQDLNQRGETVTEAGQARLDAKQGFARTAFQQLGQVAGGVGDLISRGVTTAGKLFTTQETEDSVSADLKKVAQDTGLVDAYQKLQAYKEANPERGRDIDATLGVLELALDRFGLGTLAKGKEVVEQGLKTGVDTTKQAARGAIDAVSDINVPSIPNVAPGVTQAAKDLAGRVPRAVSNVQDNLADRAARAERIRRSAPAVGKAIEVNVPDNTISLVTQTDAPTRKAMKDMLDIAESGARDARPSRVAGEAVAKQYEVIDSQRKAVGQSLEEAIKALPDTKVSMQKPLAELDTILRQNGLYLERGKVKRMSTSSMTDAEMASIQKLYDTALRDIDNLGRMDALAVHARDRLFSKMKRENSRVEGLDDILIKADGGTKSIYDTFRDVYRSTLDQIDDGNIRALNKDYAVLRNLVDEADNSIFKTSRTMGIKVDPEASAAVNLRRLEGEALSTPYFKEVADRLDTTSRTYGYDGAKPSDLVVFAEDLRTIYPDTVPKTGFQGSIRTAIKPSLMDVADKVLNAGTVGPKDQQRALRELLESLDDQSLDESAIPSSTSMNNSPMGASKAQPAPASIAQSPGTRQFERDLSLDPQSKKIEEAAYNKIIENEDGLLSEYFSNPKLSGPGGKVINTDNFRPLFTDVGYVGSNAAAVQEPSSYLAKKAWTQALKRQGDYVILTAGGSGTGKSSALKGIPKISRELDGAAAVLDSNLSSYNSAIKKINEALDAGKKVVIDYVYRDPFDSFENGVVARMINNADEGGRLVPTKVVAQNHIGSLQVAERLKNEGFTVNFIDNSLGRGKAKVSSLDEIKRKANYPTTQELTKKLNILAKRLLEAEQIKPEQYAAYIR
jgi:hypothetical protein